MGNRKKFRHQPTVHGVVEVPVRIIVFVLEVLLPVRDALRANGIRHDLGDQEPEERNRKDSQARIPSTKVTGTIVRGMETREIIRRRRRRRFWSLALLWLPTGVMATAVVRFLPGTGEAQPPSMWGMAILMAVPSLVFVAPCGLPLALGCQRLWRLGFRRAAWVAGIWLGAVTVAASLVAGLLGPIAIALYAAVLSLPVWIAWWWLARRS